MRSTSMDNATASYWLSSPHRLASFRSSQTVPQESDVVIVGTGLAGVSLAYELLKKCSEGGNTPSVTLLEARQACSGATGRNGGHVKTSLPAVKTWYEKYGPQLTARLVAWTGAQRSAIKRIVEQESLECELLVTRSYDVFYDPAQATDTKAWLLEMRQRKAEWVDGFQWLEGPHLDQMIGVKGAVAAAGGPAISLWPYKFVMGLLARVLKLGASLYTDTPVESVDDSDEPGSVKLSTSRGVIKAKKVIYATNGYTAAILPLYRAVIVPFRGQMSQVVPTTTHAHRCPNLTATYNLYHMPTSVDYLNPRPDGSIILGGGISHYRRADKDYSQSWFDTVDDATLIRDSICSYFEDIANTKLYGWERRGARVEASWTGIMGATMDSLPHVGPVPGKENQWIMAGFNGGGMTMIVTLAQEFADVLVAGKMLEESNIPLIFKSTPRRMQARFW
ncbi:FAD dependent oxidoreductase [Metarhizium album ARSEF 1941]|uniref:FAD dependent oxidoreductase n=1 Tax=Metarhizium album (strain ARSEF 1941) TaxID=1081103 RepID=A0A0B2WJ49_METAS|nr:FAD dependent oxidoreductase [Metarhizium album ARSEF 1941]KHN96071.1 FAD dependent oxidoreductase [Metarhizium album ARSEF 1941]